MTEPETFRLRSNGWAPNNDRPPVLLYRGASNGAAEPATAFEDMFNRNRWPAAWRDGVFPFHH